MAASFLRRFAFWRGPLYTPEEMYAQLASVLSHTMDERAVVEAIHEIDSFDAGAVDGPLHEKAMSVLRRLRMLDRVQDIDALRKAEAYLKKMR